MLYITDIVGNMAIFGATPLFFELSCEAAYPVAEGVTNTLMTWLNNLIGLIFLSILMIPATGQSCWSSCMATYDHATLVIELSATLNSAFFVQLFTVQKLYYAVVPILYFTCALLYMYVFSFFFVRSI